MGEIEWKKIISSGLNYLILYCAKHFTKDANCLLYGEVKPLQDLFLDASNIEKQFNSHYTKKNP